MSFIVETKFNIQTAQAVLLYRSTLSNVLNYIDIKINDGSVSLTVEESYDYPGKYEVKYAFPNTGTYNITYEFPDEDWIKFTDCTSLSEVTLPQGVTTIQNDAFKDTGLKSITIPDGVTTIGSGAFENSDLKSVHIPASVTSIAVGAGGSFLDTGWLESITVDPANPVYDSRDNSNCIIKGSEIIVGSINCTIPTSVTGIGDYAFYKHSQLKSFSIPDNITYIGDYAFYNCWQSKRRITIGSGLRSIGEYAFANCYHIHKINISAVEPPSHYDNSFYMIGESLPAQQGYLYVPEESIPNYEAEWTYLTDTLGWIIDKILPYLENTTLNAAILGESFEIGPYESDDWYISSYPDWVHPSITSNTGRMSFDLGVDGNISESFRTGVVTVVYDSTYSANITVNQDPIVLQWNEKPLDDLRNDGGSWNALLSYNLKPHQVIDWIDDWLNGQWINFDEYLHIYGNVDPVGGIVNRTGTINLTLVYQTYNGETINISANNTVSQKGEEYTYYPEVTTVAPEGGLVTTTVTSQYPLTGYKSATSSVADVTLNRVSDTEITLYASYPMAEQGVTDTIMLIGDEGFDNIPLTVVTQSKFELTWDFPTDPIHLEADKSTFELAFTSNVEISNITISNCPTWITFTRDGDKYVGVALQNTSDERSATVTFTADDWGISKTVDISQDGLYWEFATDSVHIGVEASTFDLPYTSNIEIKSFIVYDKPNWLTLKRGDSKYTITATRNTGESRTATVTFNIYGSAASRKVVFTQDGFEWILDTNSIEFNCTNSTPDNPAANPLTESISFTSTLPITELEATIQYLSGSDWLSVDYNGDIIVTALDNRLGTYREAVITLYSTEYDLSRQIAVTQLGSSFTWDASTIDISPAGGVVTFNYTGSNGFLLLSDISVENAELAWSFNGGYNGSISFTVPINTGIAKIFNPSVYAGDRLLATFTINQADPDITVDTPEIIAPAEGTEVIVYIESEIPWYVEIVGDWISVNPSSGSGDAGITITVEANPLTEIRTGYVYISNGVDREVIVINQAGAEPYLYFTKKYIPLPLAGGVRYVKLVNNTHWTTIWEIQ